MNEYTFPYINSEKEGQIKKMQEIGINTTGQTFEQMINTAIWMADRCHKEDKCNWNLPVLLGNEAKDRCDWIIGDVRKPEYNGPDDSIGIWYEKDKWVAYDNSTGDCWVEEFTDIREAYLWVTGQKEIGE